MHAQRGAECVAAVGSGSLLGGSFHIFCSTGPDGHDMRKCLLTHCQQLRCACEAHNCLSAYVNAPSKLSFDGVQHSGFNTDKRRA